MSDNIQNPLYRGFCFFSNSTLYSTSGDKSVKIVRCLTTLTSVMVSKRKPIHLNRVEKIVDYIHQNLDKPLTVTELADISCWSRWQLQRVFQEQTNHNLAQYVREQKLSRAAEQLLKSDQKVTDIALDFGFNSEVSFSRAFKQLFCHLSKTISPSRQT